MKKIKATYKNIPRWYSEYYTNRGYVYALSERLADGNKQSLLNKFNNIELVLIQSEYAPEIVHDGILIKK